MARNLANLSLERFDPAVLETAKSKTTKKSGKQAARTKVHTTERSRKSTKLVECDVEEQENDVVSDFQIEVRDRGGLTSNQLDAFVTAADRWSQLIVGDLQTVQLPSGEVVDDVLIDAMGTRIDGPSGILGQAAPTFIRNNNLPAAGFMEFDSEDLARMEADGTLVDVIVHEMGHVLGIGTLWGTMGLITTNCLNSANPVFFGQNAAIEFASLLGSQLPIPVPVENQHGPGTRCGHWRESVFGNEGMTGFVNLGPNPVSRITVGALEDMGYKVNYGAADDYSIPSQLALMLMGIGDDAGNQRCGCCGGNRRKFEPVKLADEMHM